MTDWDKAYTANKEAGNWHPLDADEPLCWQEEVTLIAAYFVGGAFALLMLGIIAGYFWESLT